MCCTVAHGPAPCEDPPLWSPYVVCVHTYIYVVCEPRHGEFTTSAAQLHILDSGYIHCAVSALCYIVNRYLLPSLPPYYPSYPPVLTPGSQLLLQLTTY